MNKIILDLTGCKSLLELHNIIKKTFGFPEHYGNNLSALWDCMWEYCRPDTIICVKGVDTLPKELGGYMEKVYEVFNDVEQEVENVIFEII